MSGLASVNAYDNDDDFSFANGGLVGIGQQGGEQVYADDPRLNKMFSGIAAPFGEQARQLARFGRGDDKVLVHMTPDEVAMFQTLAKQHGGSLTINPQTGLPEMGFFSKIGKAFKKVFKKVKKFIAPVVGLAANILMPGISPLMTAVLAGGASGIANGSLKKGLRDGLLTWGGAKLFGGMGGAKAGANSHMVGGAAANNAGAAASSVGDTIGNAVSQAAAGGAPSMGSGIAGTIGDAVSQAGGAGIYGGMYGAAPAATHAAGQLGTSALTAATQPVASAAASNAMGNVANQGFMGRIGSGIKSLASAAMNPDNAFKTLATVNMVGGLLGQREAAKREKQQRAANQNALREAEARARPLYDHSKEQVGAPSASSFPTDPYYMMNGGGHDYGFKRGGQVVDPATQKKIMALRKRYRSQQQALDDARVPGSVAHRLGIHANDPALRAAFGFTKKQGPKPQKKQVQLYEGGKVSSGVRGYAGGGGIGSLSDGMSDSIPASIDGQQPARLSEDEFVIPADVVSHLGNGSSEAGSKRLHEMLNRVRSARTGKQQQAPQINPMRMLPA